MRSNRRRDTAPELMLRKALHALGCRYRVDYLLRLDGGKVRPDIVFTKRRVAVFVDGCFWHGCPDHFRRPKSHAEYWDAKIARNVVRDRRDSEILSEAGWSVVRIWEHVPLAEAVERVLTAVERTRRAASRSALPDTAIRTWAARGSDRPVLDEARLEP